MSADQIELARQIRRTVLEQSKRANVGHIGSSLSIADILAALYSGPLRSRNDEHGDRDRFVLSKGHAALALYAVLFATKRIESRDLESFCGDGTAFGGHPEHVAPGIDFSSGSLGHGLSVGTGAALAARLDGSHRRVFVLMSDAECNEGSVWEAAMFAAHHRLTSLIAIIDDNEQQALGDTREVLDLQPLAQRWSAFGWDAREVDGHDPAAINALIDGRDTESGKPLVLIAKTIFGKGVSYMERQVKWHYWPMSDEDFSRALDETGVPG